MIQTEDNTSFHSDSDISRRRSTFYVPLALTADNSKNDEIPTKNQDDCTYNSDRSFDWSLNESLNSTGDLLVSSEKENRLKRYGIVLNGSINIDESIEIPQRQTQTSTPIRLMKARSRNNILSLPDKSSSPVKEKSKTLPQNLTTVNTFPPKTSLLLKTTSKIGLSSSSENCERVSSLSSSLSPKKSLSFIRRTHSTKLSRNNSLLKSVTHQKCAEQVIEKNDVNITRLPLEFLLKCFNSDSFEGAVKSMFFKNDSQQEDLEKNNTPSDSQDDKYERDSGSHSGK